MPHKQNTKLKLPVSAADLKQLEEEVAKVAADLREIRLTLGESGLPHVTLKPGTFRFYLSALRKGARTFKSELEKQVIDKHVVEFEGKKMAEIAAKKKNR